MAHDFLAALIELAVFGTLLFRLGSKIDDRDLTIKWLREDLQNWQDRYYYAELDRIVNEAIDELTCDEIESPEFIAELERRAASTEPTIPADEVLGRRKFYDKKHCL